MLHDYILGCMFILACGLIHTWSVHMWNTVSCQEERCVLMGTFG